MATIYRGTTPTITLELPTSFDITEFDVAYLTFSNDERTTLLEKDIDDMQIGTSNNIAVFNLTQEDTLLFDEDTTIQYQFRLKDGSNAYATKIETFRIGSIIKEGSI